MPKLAENITLAWSRERDRIILKKLQRLAPYMYLSVNTLAKKILHEYADNKIRELGIHDYEQPASYAGCYLTPAGVGRPPDRA